jgi:hypothetical protein
MGFNLFAAAASGSRIRPSNPHSRSSITGIDRASPNIAQGKFEAGTSTSSPWPPYDQSPRTPMSSPTTSSDLGSSVNNPTESYSSSRTSSSMTLASPSPLYNQNDMSPFSNDRPSLARQIEMDRWREKTREMVARVQREEDERVRAYRERYGYYTAESGSGSASRRDSDTEEGGSRPTHLGNSSPPTIGQTRSSRGRSSTSSTAPLRTGFPTNNQDDSESDPQQRETPPRPPAIDNDRTSTSLCDDAPAVPPSVPPKIPQEGVEPSATHPGGSQRGDNNPFAEVDRLIGGFNMYDRQERARKKPQHHQK